MEAKTTARRDLVGTARALALAEMSKIAGHSWLDLAHAGEESCWPSSSSSWRRATRGRDWPAARRHLWTASGASTRWKIPRPVSSQGNPGRRPPSTAPLMATTLGGNSSIATLTALAAWNSASVHAATAPRRLAAPKPESGLEPVTPCLVRGAWEAWERGDRPRCPSSTRT